MTGSDTTASSNPSDDRFLKNARDARENGYDLICAACGCGMTDDDFEDADLHETGCPNVGRDRAAEMAEFIEQRLSGTRFQHFDETPGTTTRLGCLGLTSVMWGLETCSSSGLGARRARR